MNIFIPRKAVKAITREIFIANSRGLRENVNGKSYLLKMAAGVFNMSGPDGTYIDRHDAISQSVISEALVRSYVCNRDSHYSTTIHVNNASKADPMVSEPFWTYHIGHDSGKPYITVVKADGTMTVRFELNKLIEEE